MENSRHDESLQSLDFRLDKIIADFECFKKMLNTAIKARDKEIAELKTEVKGLNARMLKLEDKVADGDVEHRKKNLIISGDEIHSPEVNENCVATVRELVQQKLRLVISTVDFVSAIRLGKPNSRKKVILVKLKSPADNENVKKSCKAMKPNICYCK